jgi:hypothetical protein
MNRNARSARKTVKRNQHDAFPFFFLAKRTRYSVRFALPTVDMITPRNSRGAIMLGFTEHHFPYAS